MPLAGSTRLASPSNPGWTEVGEVGRLRAAPLLVMSNLSNLSNLFFSYR